MRTLPEMLEILGVDDDTWFSELEYETQNKVLTAISQAIDAQEFCNMPDAWTGEKFRYCRDVVDLLADTFGPMLRMLDADIEAKRKEGLERADAALARLREANG